MGRRNVLDRVNHRTEMEGLAMVAEEDASNSVEGKQL